MSNEISPLSISVARPVKKNRLLAFALFTLFIASGCSQQNPEQLKKALFDAVKADDTRKVRKCISNGVAVNDPETPGGWSALHYGAQAGNEEIVKLLLDAGADPNYIGYASRDGGTRISLKPVLVAQASLLLAKQAQGNPFLHFQDPKQEQKLKDPATPARYEHVIKMLEAVTKN